MRIYINPAPLDPTIQSSFLPDITVCASLTLVGGGSILRNISILGTVQTVNNFKYNPVYFVLLQKSLWHQRSIVRKPKERPHITAPVMLCKAQHHCQCQIQSTRTVMQNEPSVALTRRKRVYQISEYHLLKVTLHSMHILQLMKSWTRHKLQASLNCLRLSAWRRSVTNEATVQKHFDGAWLCYFSLILHSGEAYARV